MHIFAALVWILLLSGNAYAYEGNGPGSHYAPDIPPQVWKLDIEGNKTYPDVVIKDRIATGAPTFWEKIKFWNKTGHELDETEVKKDVIRIRNFYQRRGFSGVEVSYRIEEGNKEWKKKVVFSIDENAAIRIKNLSFEFDTLKTYEKDIKERSAFAKVRQSQPFKPGKRYQQILEPEVIGQFVQVLKNLGFSYAKVDIEAKIDSTKLAADVNIKIHTGPKTYFDTIKVEGAESVSEGYIIREAGLKKGKGYSQDKIEDAQRELFNHHLFRFATIDLPEQEHDSTLNLNIRVKENSPRSVQASIGFGTEEYVRGQVSWTHRNVFHRGHKFTATGRASFIEQRLSLDYLFPYFYNTKSSIVISPFGQHLLEKSFELLRGGITNSYIYHYSESVTGTISYQFTKNKELSKRSEASLPDTTLSYDLSSLQFSGYYSQELSREQKGWVVQPYAEISGFLGLATFSFQKLSVDVRRYIDLTKSTQLAARVQTGGLFNVNTDSLPNNIRFFLGGTNSVRGWLRQELGPKRVRVRTESVEQPNGTSEDTTKFVRYIPVGGRAMFGFNIEIRQDLSGIVNRFGIAAFLDGGQIWNDVNSIGDRPIQFGAGGGLRYRSPIGPIRVDVGYKLNPTDEDLNIYQGQNFGNMWDRIGIHVSIGQAF